MGPKVLKTEQDARQHLKDKGSAIIMDQDEPKTLYGYDNNYALVGVVSFKEFSGTGNPFYF